MTDTIMCEGKDCPYKKTCHRYVAKPSEFTQSYFSKPPYNKEKDDCDFYWNESFYQLTIKGVKR